MKTSVKNFVLGFAALFLSLQSNAENTPGEGFLTFEAIQHDGKIDIAWKINPTSNVKKFVVLKSKDGINFTPFTELNGSAYGPEYEEYFEVDYSPFAGTSYYRLMEEKNDGQIFYSEIVPVNLQYLDGKWHIVNESHAAKPTRYDLYKLKAKEMLLVLRDKNGAEFFADVTVTDVKGKNVEAKANKGEIPAGKYLVIATSKDELFSKDINIVK